ncbi:MAG: response regulator transcription factor [Verrucomicrobia bacterium]|nr:response regulator transcription factor [Cytophagales bacterium]
MKLRCLIMDDEFLARQLLEGYVAKIPFLELVGKCENAFKAMEALENDTADILFADIDMPDLNGIDFIKTLKHRPEIILTTAYSEYALEGYQLEITDYLLKPIYFERFIRAVNKAKELIYLKKGLQNPEKPSSQQNSIQELNVSDKKFIFIKVGSQKIIRLNLDDILFVESLHEYIRIHLKSEKYVIYCSLKNLLSLLPAQKFIQIHRSHIIHFDKISSIEGNIIKIGSSELKIGKNYREELFNAVKDQGIGVQAPSKKS